MEPGEYLLLQDFEPLSSSKSSSWISIAMLEYYSRKPEFYDPIIKSRSMQCHCCHSQYRESHLTWNPMVHREGVYLLSRATPYKDNNRALHIDVSHTKINLLFLPDAILSSAWNRSVTFTKCYIFVSALTFQQFTRSTDILHNC